MCIEDYKLNMNIPRYIMKGGHYEVKIENIYDPSKFWVILKFKELAIFMKYLRCFYDNVENRKIVPKSDLKKNFIYIVRRRDMYYRSTVMPLLLPDRNQVKVFMIDFGFIVNICTEDIFYISEKHQVVPRFAIRASLAYISPTDHSKIWSQLDLKIFCKILQNKRIFAEVCEIDTEQNILFCEIYINPEVTNKSIGDILVNLKMAKYNERYTSHNTELTKYKSKVKYPHLFPSFEKLENGSVPSSLWERNLLKDSVLFDVLYKDYYQYQDINCVDK
ncbi:tudor domain-containing protein 5-like [Anoplophora glabripennis]|uniref:tudor domain-containing protein 5-like n=1 Tax=Anoplophora glabripennis TaxID=217634 RepID=UPI000873A897|nr:tudor domain-containing protein 5-like [Anoplophora glabripennis]